MKIHGDYKPGCWQVAWVQSHDELEELLAAGWEPFAVHDLDVWLRRRVPATPTEERKLTKAERAELTAVERERYGHGEHSIRLVRT